MKPRGHVTQPLLDHAMQDSGIPCQTPQSHIHRLYICTCFQEQARLSTHAPLDQLHSKRMAEREIREVVDGACGEVPTHICVRPCDREGWKENGGRP